MKVKIWWLHPVWYVLGTSCLIIIALVTSDEMYYSAWGTPKWIDFDTAIMSISTLLMFTLGLLLALGIKTRKKPQWLLFNPDKFLIIVARVLLILILIGYSAWFYAAYSRGFSISLAEGVLKGEKGIIYSLKQEYFRTIPGLTSLVQFGPCYIVLAVYIGVRQGWAKVCKGLLIVLGLTILRAFFFSERLALIELFIPGLVVYVRLLTNRPKWVSLLPLGIVAIVIGLFSSFEYFRSWVNAYTFYMDSYGEFVYQRLIGYYLTAINNGILLTKSIPDGLDLPYFTFEWFWRFPVLKQIFSYTDIANVDISELYDSLLFLYANPEFNNPSGILLPIVDFGIFGGLFVWVLLGFITGILYKWFTEGSIFGLFIYPIWFIGLLELPRILYWTSSRSFPTFIALLVVLFLLTVGRQKATFSTRDNSKMINKSNANLYA
ncbi:O-antigen polymerase [Calditerricola satsumensis]|uniref:Oligosaccharide repeat unit polymerase n=1 Tax=Calditerricola satsumensis TaxID=373054 RepID=A0A8J3BC26_9BACI|nr:O-antigen polymerase [Calditerricola satsumensis]GGJ95901.1 hypothetical protein GCM10007043_07100 [Calditerricola satsumensis]